MLRLYVKRKEDQQIDYKKDLVDATTDLFSLGVLLLEVVN
jgi:hypothetical protein